MIGDVREPREERRVLKGHYFVAPDSAPPVAPTMFVGLDPQSVEEEIARYADLADGAALEWSDVARDAEVRDRFASDKASGSWAMVKRRGGARPGTSVGRPPGSAKPTP